MAEGDGITPKPGEQPDKGGNDAPAWLAQLPDPLKAEKSFTSFKTIGDLATDYLNKGKEIETLRGQTANTIPKLPDNATKEQSEAFYKALGRPDKPEEYQFPKGDGVEHDPTMVSWAQGVFHRAGLSKSQGQVVSQAWDAFITQMTAEQKEEAKKSRDGAEATLKKELGEKYPETAELTARLLKENASPEEIKFLDESGLGNHPALIRLLAKLAAKTGEDSTVRGNPLGGKIPIPGQFDYSKVDQGG